jgi:hypothetical protein
LPYSDTASANNGSTESFCLPQPTFNSATRPSPNHTRCPSNRRKPLLIGIRIFAYVDALCEHMLHTSPLAAHMCNACLISGCVHYVVTRRTVPLGADRVDTTYGTTWWETRLTIPARRAVPRLRRTSSARWAGFFVHYVDETRSTNSSNEIDISFSGCNNHHNA